MRVASPHMELATVAACEKGKTATVAACEKGKTKYEFKVRVLWEDGPWPLCTRQHGLIIHTERLCAKQLCGVPKSSGVDGNAAQRFVPWGRPAGAMASRCADNVRAHARMRVK